MSENSQKIIQKIHERHVKHRPKWYFLIKTASVIAALVVAVILAALAISIEESILEKGIGVHGFFSSEFFNLVFQGISLLWILCTIVFVILAFLNLRHIKEGYRYRALWIVLGILFLVGTFALLFRNEGMGDRLESAVEQSGFYHGGDQR